MTAILTGVAAFAFFLGVWATTDLQRRQDTADLAWCPAGTTAIREIRTRQRFCFVDALTAREDKLPRVVPLAKTILRP